MHSGRGRPLAVALGLFLVTACAASPGVRELGPESDVRAEVLVLRTSLRMIRVVNQDSTRVTLYAPRVEGDALVGVRDAGPPARVPLDSVAYVAAYLAAPPEVSTGEWVRLGGFVVWVVVLSACAADMCSFLGGGS